MKKRAPDPETKIPGVEKLVLRADVFPVMQGGKWLMLGREATLTRDEVPSPKQVEDLKPPAS
jgi:hypothetical protein